MKIIAHLYFFVVVLFVVVNCAPIKHKPDMKSELKQTEDLSAELFPTLPSIEACGDKVNGDNFHLWVLGMNASNLDKSPESVQHYYVLNYQEESLPSYVIGEADGVYRQVVGNNYIKMRWEKTDFTNKIFLLEDTLKAKGVVIRFDAPEPLWMSDATISEDSQLPFKAPFGQLIIASCSGYASNPTLTMITTFKGCVDRVGKFEDSENKIIVIETQEDILTKYTRYYAKNFGMVAMLKGEVNANNLDRYVFESTHAFSDKSSDVYDYCVEEFLENKE